MMKAEFVDAFKIRKIVLALLAAILLAITVGITSIFTLGMSTWKNYWGVT
jgi:ABC-type transport system involved in cytochrome bd biosynthesis fused ATPase/permease subunit